MAVTGKTIISKQRRGTTANSVRCRNDPVPVIQSPFGGNFGVFGNYGVWSPTDVKVPLTLLAGKP